ncbi:MAG TPA: pseudouridine synthase [Puia sp.]|jgi:23S rRNA pseudouridine2605 synthase|nr:pseudouridine synthase [Puia sp.]
MKPKKPSRSARSKSGRSNAKPGSNGSSSNRNNAKSDQPGGAKSGRGKPGLKRKTDNFNKFYNKKRNSAIKEAFRQEKKAAKKERKEGIERHFEERRLTRGQQAPDQLPRDQQSPTGPSRKPYPAKGPFRPDTATPANPDVPGRPRLTKGPNPAPHGAATPGQLPLNKYISNGGICSRRDAADLIRQGKVTVNGKLITEPGTKVNPTDLVKVGAKKVTISNNFVYILLNKPKDYITTTDDPLGRKTVLDLIRPATTERVYPIGRLDRNTSGVLLLTNDGDLAQKLAHPSHQIKKIYHVTLDKPLTKTDFDKIAAGAVVLEDGPAPVDALAYADPKDRTQIGLEIHSGRNRIVRRIFEQLGYDVRGLDRVMYAGLTKKNVQRGHWRLLAEKEIRILKYLNSSIKGSPGRAKDLAPDAHEREEIEKKVHILRTEHAAKQIVPVKRAAHPNPTPRGERPATGHPERRPVTDHSTGRPERHPITDRSTGRPERHPAEHPERRPAQRPEYTPRHDKRPAHPERPAPRSERPERPATGHPPAKGIRPKTRRPGKPRKPSGSRNPSGPRNHKKEE